MEAGDRLEARSKAGERGKTTIVLFASSENNHVAPDFVSSRSSYLSCLCKCLEKAHVSAPLSLFIACGIRLSWDWVIKTHCAYILHEGVSNWCTGIPFPFAAGKDS